MNNDHILKVIEQFCQSNPGRSVSFKNLKTHSNVISTNGTILRPVASVMKVPLIIALYDAHEAGSINLHQKLKISDFPKTRYVSLLNAFSPETELMLSEIAALALITSDNPMIVVINDLVSFEDTNTVLKNCGCSDNAQMAAGFTEVELGPLNRANLLTSNDTMLILDHLLNHEKYRPIITAMENNLRNNRIPALLPDSAIIAHKTGSLEGVVNNVGIVKDENIHYSIAFLCDNESDSTLTSNEIAQCSLEIYNSLKNES